MKRFALMPFKIQHLVQASVLVVSLIALSTATVSAGRLCGAGTTTSTPTPAVQTAIDIGCVNKGNPITDMLFAVIRFLSAGVGLVVIGSIVLGGIQYTTSRGDPQATAKAVTRIRSSIVALIIFIFGFAILNYLIPAGVLK